jgi:alpha-amylase
VLSYMSSHDDGAPFDAARQHPFDTANRLLLSPGAVQIYYGDETARLLKYEGAVGDAALRSPMNWDELASNAKRDGYRIADVRRHWSLLGRFRHSHPAIGAGVHKKLADAPYTFSRTLGDDHVVVALDVPAGRAVAINVGDVFDDGDTVTDRYSGKRAVVTDGKVRFTAQRGVVLIED